MTTYLYRGNDKGEILDASGQVVGRVVPVEPTEKMISEGGRHVGERFIYRAMLSAATIDLAGLPRVPERVLLESDPFCPQCGHNRDTSCISSVGVQGGEHKCQMCSATWTEAALDAIGVPK